MNDNKIKEMTFSFSRCNSFGHCKYEWYLNYLLVDENGCRIYNNEQNFYAAFGKFCHTILEKYLRMEINKGELVYYYKEHYKDNVDTSEIKTSTAEKYYLRGIEYFENIDFDWLIDYEIIGVEIKYQFVIEGYMFVGFVDLLIKHKVTGKMIVVDHKSSDYPVGKKGSVFKKKRKDYDAYKRQLYLYCKAVFEEYGEYPSELWWNYFKENKWLKLKFKTEEYSESLQWAVNEIEKIKIEEDFLPDMNYFYCKNLCGFRNSCEYKLMGGE